MAMQTATKVALMLMLAWASQMPPSPATGNRGRPGLPDQIGEEVLRDFTTRISRYLELRTGLEAGLPTLTGADDPAFVRSAELALAGRIRSARAGARQGEVFTPQVAAAFRKVLRQEMDAGAWKEVMDENPRAFPHHVNDSYPKSLPLSTVPPGILARLPPLPEGLQYRFVGTDLILHDTKANLIVDRLPEAIPIGGPPRRGVRQE